jgi:pSer/pThr/pTyr-binding forkhead associated (FHA) protein
MEVKLRVRVGAAAGKELRVPGPKFFIGRAEDCHLRPKSDLISRHHCVLIIDESVLTVRDLGSRNGTLVNGQRVVGERELAAGDVLRVGPLEFDVLIVSAPPAATKRPKVTSIKEAAVRTAQGRAGDDADVTQWLGEEGATAPGVAPETETREIEAAETEEITLGTTLVNVPPLGDQKPSETAQPAVEPVASDEPTPAATGESVSPPHAKPAAPKPGKLPFRPKAADSRQAAADVLKKFFNRR